MNFGLLKTLVFLILLGFQNPLWAARRLYLTIGIDQYKDSYWSQLKYASKDAQDFAKALDATFDGGVVLTSQSEKDRWVTRDDVIQSMNQLEKENFSEDDVVVIYLSAHGTIGKTIRDGRTILEKVMVTAETDSEAPTFSGVSHTQLLEIFQRLKSRRKVLILDTCYSGGGKSRLNQKILDLLARQKGAWDDNVFGSPVEGSIILSASAWGEEAIESARHQNSLYTYHLIQGFQHDLNQDGAISITEAHSYASRQVMEESQGRQHPSARIEVVGSDPIVVRGEKKKGNPLLFAYEKMMRKLKVELNGQELADLKKGGASVPPGSYRLSIRDLNDQLLLVKTIRLEEGREYSLARFLEYKPEQALRIGPAQLWLHDAGLKQKLGDKPLLGYQLGWSYDHILGPWAGELSLFHAQKSDGIDSEGTRVPQTLRWTQVTAQLAQTWTGADLRVSGIKRDPDYYVSIGGGLGLLYLERHVEDASYLDNDQTLLRPFLGLTSEIGWEDIDRNLKFGLKVDTEWIRNPSESGYPRVWHWSKIATMIAWTF
ncbi:caspase family protein [Oligoflexus tunisiensis]|uniref:caspase family protein n=1 Tax=Oligoflexus tunisiensis TaxID=708132 RepID=UPI00114D0C0E|nr:caspase family protein [Oligoflexus tunisiensis]